MIEVSDDGSSGISEALSEALRALEAEHERRVEEMIRQYQAGPPAAPEPDPRNLPPGYLTGVEQSCIVTHVGRTDT
jgi:hypothetical protein